MTAIRSITDTGKVTAHPSQKPWLLLLLLLLQNLYSAQIQACSSRRRCGVAGWENGLAGEGK